ncbi:TonB-dependent receptor [Lysobacter enzymogenes]|uniref:TonB-dependent receptor domain-containing protein n=1 Tax=Lysobacter enzymogenes TaxID=69 RepID=UPI00374815A2
MTTSALAAAISLALCLGIAGNASADECRTAIDRARLSCANDADPQACSRRALPAPCGEEYERLNAATDELHRVTVVGTRFGIDVLKYPGSASVLTEQDLDDYPDLIQALKKVPGLDTGNDGGRAIGQHFSIRGFGHGSESRVILMQDGVRRSANLFANQVSGFGMDSDLLKQVDVVRGSSGISYGGGAIGGVIGSTTKDAGDFLAPGRDYGVALNYRFDSNDQRQAYAAFAAAPQDRPFEALAFVKRAKKGDLTQAGELIDATGRHDNVVDNEEDIDTAFVKLGWNFGEGHKLSLSHFDYAIDARTGWNSLYHATFGAANGAVLGQRSQRDTVLRYTLAPAGSRWLDLSVTAYKTRGYYERGYERGVDLYYKNLDERWGVSAQNLMRFATGPVEHRLLFGLDYEHREEDGIYILDGVRTGFNSMPNTYRDFGAFVQHESRWLDGRLAVQLGGRYDRFDRRVQGVAETYDNSRFSPRLGLSYEIAGGFVLLANYSEAFRAPTPHETSSDGPLNIHYWYRPNPRLKSETSKEYEAGFSWSRAALLAQDDRIAAKAMYFNGTISDMIQLVVDYGSVSPAKSEYVRYENVGEVEREGVEVELSYDRPRWGGYFSYESLDMKDAASGRKTPSAFADRARLGLRWRPFDDDFSVSADVSHWFEPDQNPKTLVSAGTTYWYVRDAYTQTNLQLRWRPSVSGVPFFDGSTQFLAGINNVFDQKRLNASGVETSTRTGLGRNLYFSISKQF